MTLNEFHELHNKSADETRQLINQLSVETDNWRGTGENLVELVKQAIQNYPGYELDDNYYAQVDPYFITNQGAPVYFDNLREAGESLADSNKRSYYEDLGLVFKKEGTTVDSAAGNILAGVCGFDGTYANNKAGFRTNNPYGVEWHFEHPENLSENWYNLYRWFSQDLDDNYSDYDGNIKAVKATKNSIRILSAAVNDPIESKHVYIINHKKEKEEQMKKFLASVVSLAKLKDNLEELNRTYSLNTINAIKERIPKLYSESLDAIDIIQNFELYNIDALSKYLMKGYLNKIYKSLAEAGYPNFILAQVINSDNINLLIAQAQNLGQVVAKATERVEAYQQAELEKKNTADKAKAEQELKARNGNIEYSMKEVGKLAFNYYKKLDNYNSKKDNPKTEVKSDGTLIYNEKGVQYMLPKPNENISEDLLKIVNKQLSNPSIDTNAEKRCIMMKVIIDSEYFEDICKDAKEQFESGAKEYILKDLGGEDASNNIFEDIYNNAQIARESNK